MNSGKLFWGVLAGIAAGTLLGIALAPDKGSETRKKIARKGSDYAESIKDKIDDVVDTLTEKFEKVKEEVADLIDHGKATTEEARKKAKASANA